MEKQIKAIEGQGENVIKALEEHRKQLAKSSSKKESFFKNLLIKGWVKYKI